MSRPAVLLAPLAVLLVSLPASSAISCYKCTDLLDVDTGDSSLANTFDDIFKSISSLTGLAPCSEFRPKDARFRADDCTLGSSCVKMVLSDGKTTRSCSPLPQEDGCTKRDGAIACSCSSDFCNAAGRSSPALLLLLLPAALLALTTGRL
ncbi:hypothetical protein FJT64_018657 [Amphibalanus amphitrite]|uniref:Protein sleepless n=1 Tax=Amphibalanus amphitrite TaxID=1232801 RepID=A0A6A4X7E3_AMPAM|nr:uncharacterized protein LOC122377774 [Amphibalanus amphitrite]KAF0310321.1 hypothetical protein FJT64_018657 [Amphibalanus amphitrite]